jgi:Cu/Ag efflux pump CusA
MSQGIFFSAAIIIAAFVPLFTLSGIEGHIFGPMAKTYAYAIAGGLLATFTVTPALSGIFLPADIEERDTWLVRKLHQAYRPVMRLALANRTLTLGGMAVLLVVTALCTRSLGLEFLPKLEEGAPPCRHRCRWRRATRRSIKCGVSSGAIRKPSPRSRSMAGRTTAPTQPASSTPNSLCHSNRSTPGRPAWTRKSWSRR